MSRFIFLFLGCLGVLFTLELLQPIDQHVILPFTVVLAKISTWLIQWLDGNTLTQGKVIQSLSTGFAISIERGCNGVEAVIILVSAMLAFPAPWKHKGVGILLGFFAIQAVNILRIVSLFFLGQWSTLWFNWFHLYLWQALIVLDALLVFLVWLRYLPLTPSPIKNKNNSSPTSSLGGEVR